MDNVIIRAEKVEGGKALSDHRVELYNQFLDVRYMTFNILEPLEIEDYVVQTEAYMSPPRWHIGHTTWFYEQLLRVYYKDKFVPYKEDYAFYFNSYYLTFGKLFNKAKRGTLSRPTVNETINYCNHINKQVMDFFLDESIELTEDMKRKFILGYNHEYQHQELIIYDMQHLLQDDYNPVDMKEPPASSNGSPLNFDIVKIPCRIYEIKIKKKRYGNRFASDIEMPKHKIYLNDYLIDRYPVTNGQFLEFINDGGYKEFKHWLSDAWYAVQDNEWNAPLYWLEDDNGEWYKYDFRGKAYIKDILNEPVTHISFFEADAFAKWAGKRLPTEGEWEKAASYNEEKGESTLFPWGDEDPSFENTNLMGMNIWKPTDVNTYEKGKSHYGCYQMIGDTWEWTTSEFMPYPGFKSGFSEYNDKWFNNQKVLRGGSFGTPKYSTRNTYRNFFRTNERWLISGFRCVKDI